jgi:gamma-glutamylcyclotransferase (GGCT)/AIG2-like uncharacterized protein YtfP
MPLLFAYGTLQHASVQRSVFGRRLQGLPDELVGFDRSLVDVSDPRFATGGTESLYPIVRWSGAHQARVGGTVYELTDRDLVSADRYEPPPYQRIWAVLASGKEAWVYADTRDHGDAPR